METEREDRVALVGFCLVAGFQHRPQLSHTLLSRQPTVFRQPATAASKVSGDEDVQPAVASLWKSGRSMDELLNPVHLANRGLILRMQSRIGGGETLNCPLASCHVGLLCYFMVPCSEELSRV